MSRPFSLLIATKPVWVTNPTLDVALKDAVLTRILNAHDAVSYALHSGTLPDGVTVSSSGELSGTPTEDGSYVFTVRATGESANASTDRTFTILVAAQPAWVSPQELPALPVATSVTYQLVADGGTSFSLQSGLLPGGLTLSPLGLLSGTPGLVGSYAFVVRAVSTHPDFVTDRSFTLQVNESPVWVTDAALADVATGTAISLQFEASLSPTYSVMTGAVPIGTTLSAQGVLSGTPTDPGVYTFTVRASNAPGYGSNRTFTILVVATPVWVTSSPLSDVFVDAPMSLQFVATGATGFSLVGTLPAGVTLASNGLLSGTPTAFPYPVRVGVIKSWHRPGAIAPHEFYAGMTIRGGDGNTFTTLLTSAQQNVALNTTDYANYYTVADKTTFTIPSPALYKVYEIR